jgi:hypothetical protein
MQTPEEKKIDEQIAELLNRLEFELPEHFNRNTRAYWVLRLLSVTDKVKLALDAMIKATHDRTGGLSDVAHDMGGIKRHWNGTEFENCFCPRFLWENIHGREA